MDYSRGKGARPGKPSVGGKTTWVSKTGSKTETYKVTKAVPKKGTVTRNVSKGQPGFEAAKKAWQAGQAKSPTKGVLKPYKPKSIAKLKKTK